LLDQEDNDAGDRNPGRTEKDHAKLLKKFHSVL
jgi:hypothetical protein